MFYAEKPRQQKSQWCKRHLHLSCPRRIPGQGVSREGKGCWQEEGKWYRERNADSLGWAFSPVPTWTSRASPCGDQSGPWGVWFSSSTAFSCSGKKPRSDTETQILGLEVGQSIQKSLRNTGKSFRTSTTCGLHTICGRTGSQMYGIPNFGCMFFPPYCQNRMLSESKYTLVYYLM